jgi:HEAT repeat protein
VAAGEFVIDDKGRRALGAAKRILLSAAACAFVAWAGIRIWRDGHSTETTLRLREALEQLESQSAADRAAAAGNLRFAAGRNDVDTALRGLTRAIGDEDTEVRTIAAQSLGWLIESVRKPRKDADSPEQVGKWTLQASRVLVQSVSDREASVRAAVLCALAATAKLPGSDILGGMTSMPPQIDAVSTEKRPAWQSKAELSKALDDGSAKWSRETARLYHGYSDVPPPPELVAGLQDESLVVRRAAMQALQAFPLGLDPALPILLSILEDGSSDAEMRERARATLKLAWPAPAAVPALTSALQSRRGEVRAIAAFLLGRIGPRAIAAIVPLRQMLDEARDSASGRVVQDGPWTDPPCAAARALGEISSSDEVITALVAVLGSESSDRRDAAARALADIGEPARVAVPAVLAAYSNWLDSNDSEFGGGYALSFALERLAPGTTSESEAVRALIRGLESANEGTIQFSARALGRFGKASGPAVPRLRVIKETASTDSRSIAETSLDAIEGASKRPAQ